jgi:hypothetical protein
LNKIVCKKWKWSLVLETPLLLFCVQWGFPKNSNALSEF